MWWSEPKNTFQVTKRVTLSYLGVIHGQMLLVKFSGKGTNLCVWPLAHHLVRVHVGTIHDCNGSPVSGKWIHWLALA